MNFNEIISAFPEKSIHDWKVVAGAASELQYTAFGHLQVPVYQNISSNSNVINSNSSHWEYEFKPLNNYLPVEENWPIFLLNYIQHKQNQLYFTSHFLINIALVRAAKQLLNKEIEILLPEGTFENFHQNLVAITSFTLAAVLGGATKIIIPENEDKEHQRLIQNMLEIIQQEAFLTSNQDFLQGSFFIENLTQAIVEHIQPKIEAQ